MSGLPGQKTDAPLGAILTDISLVPLETSRSPRAIVVGAGGRAITRAVAAIVGAAGVAVRATIRVTVATGVVAITTPERGTP